jgi:hypothetical protein
MPDKRTFQIKPIRDLIDSYDREWVDPFPYPFKRDALETLGEIKTGSSIGVLYDPPYSPRQLKECYDSLGMSLHDTTSGVWKRWKDEIARVTKPGGIVISFGWSTNGIGMKRGFSIKEILLIAHGGNHNDTICTVEQKDFTEPFLTEGENR